MKKHVTHIKKIEYTPSDGFRIIKRSTHEYLKTQNKVSFDDIVSNSIVEDDFAGERFICTDDEEVRDFLEFYESQKEGVQIHVFLKKDFKDFIEIPKDEYERELILFSNVILSTAINQQSRNLSVDKEIDRVFKEVQKKHDALINRFDKSRDELKWLWSKSETIRWW